MLFSMFLCLSSWRKRNRLHLPVPIHEQCILASLYQSSSSMSWLPFTRSIWSSGKSFRHFIKRSSSLFIGTVCEITNDDKPFSFAEIKHGHQPLEICFINVLWYGDARFPEMPCFAKVQVSDDQRIFFFPEKTTLGRYPESIDHGMICGTGFCISAVNKVYM